MKFINYLRGLLLLVVAPLLTFAVSLAGLVWLGVLRRNPESIHGLVRLWGRMICGLGGVQVSVEGLENLQPGRPYIFAGNHQSQFDIIALQGYLPINFKWLAKKELFQIPIWGTAMRMAGYIPIDRSRGRQAMKSLNEAAQRIAEGTSVVIFPEGTRSPDGNLHPFKPGGMVLAIKSQVELVPMAIHGTFSILPKGSLLMQPGTVHIRLAPPVATQGLTTRDKKELAERLEESVAALLASPE